MRKAPQVCLISILLATSFNLPVVAQTPPSPSPDSATSLRITPRFGVGYTTSGAGFAGFTRLEGFLPFYQNPGKELLFLEGRLSLDNQSNLGGNLLVGYRVYNLNSDRIFGGYFSYDRRDTDNNAFNQVGVGFETLGNWDARINAYFPTGDIRQLAGESLVGGLGSFRFQDHFLLVDRVRQFESAATVIDTEFGGKLADLGAGSLRGYGGLYYITAQGGDTALGVRGRLEFLPTDYLTLNLALQSDRIFETKLVASLGITFPGSSPRGAGEISETLSRLGQSVERQSAITIIEKTEQEQVVALNPTTRQPWRFQHILLDNNPNPTGNGTFNLPFNLVQSGLDQTQSDGNDIVYVQYGTNPGIPPFIIPDDVQVLSTGLVQQIDILQLGNSPFQLPLSGTVMLPTIVPGATASVTMGNRTTLAGFEIINAGTNGIEGKNIDTVNIRDNVITNSTEHGILLLNTTGNVAIDNNKIDTTGLLSAFAIANEYGSVNLRVANNQLINAHNNDNEYVEADGIRVSLIESAVGTGNISNNTIEGNRSHGILLSLGDQASAIFDILNNSISGNQINGIAIDAAENANAIANISNNTISENQSSGISLGLQGQAQGTATISNNTISQNQFGVSLFLGETSSGTVNIADSTISQNQFGGILLFQEGESQGTVNIANSTISENQSSGISVGLAATASGTVNIADSTISQNQENGIFLFQERDSQGIVNISNSTISENQENGILLFQDQDSQARVNISSSMITVDIANSTISQNQSGGILLLQQTESQGKVNIANSTISENQGDGITLRLFGNADGEFTIKDNDEISRNNGNGIAVFMLEDARANLTIDNNKITENQVQLEQTSFDNQGNGIGIVMSDNSTANATINNNTISENNAQVNDASFANNGNGIGVLIAGNSTANFTINSNTISENNAEVNSAFLANNGNGIGVLIVDNSTANFTINSNTISANQVTVNETFSSNNGNGLAIGMLGDSRGNSTIENNTISGNQGNGVNVVLSDTAQGEFTIKENQAISGNNTNGIAVVMLTDSTGNFAIDNNVISENGNSGILVGMFDNSTANVNINNNTISANGFQDINLDNAEGIGISTASNSILELLLQGNIVTNNAHFGVFVNADEQSQIKAGVRFNTLTNNPGGNNPNGLVVQTRFPSPTVCLDLSNNTSDNGFYLSNPDPTSIFKATIQNNQGDISIDQSGIIEPRDDNDCPVP